jgi:hypothetical protein
MDQLPSHLPRDEADLIPLLRLPDECREFCEGPVAAGLARSGQEYWEVILGSSNRHGEATMLEMLVAALVAGHAPAKTESRSEADRFEDAMSSILGRPLTRTNERSDKAALVELAEHVWPETDDSELRQFARTVVKSRRLGAAEEESVIRRLVRKYKANCDHLIGDANGIDYLDAALRHRALRFLRKALAAVGIPTAERSLGMHYVDWSMDKASDLPPAT